MRRLGIHGSPDARLGLNIDVVGDRFELVVLGWPLPLGNYVVEFKAKVHYSLISVPFSHQLYALVSFRINVSPIDIGTGPLVQLKESLLVA